VGYAGLRDGSLGTLVFGAAAPFVLLVLVRLTGWVRPPAWNRGRAVARLGLGVAVSAAFVPGSMFIYALVAVLLVIVRAFFVGGGDSIRSFVSVLVGLLTGWLLLLPWSTTWFADGGPLNQLFDNSKTYAASFAEHGMSAVLLGQTPETPVFFGLALPVMGLLAVFIGDGQRKRMALLLWTSIALMGLIVTAIAAGAFPPFVASPTEAGVIISVCFSGLVGLAVGAFRLDLPRRDFGYLHWLTLAALALSIFLFAAGLGPALWHGEWQPGAGHGEVSDPRTVVQISSLLDAQAEQEGPFRALWIGPDWEPPTATATRPLRDSFITAPGGQLLTDLFEKSVGDAETELDRVLASVDAGATDEGGSLLGVFNVGYVVLERGSSADPWLGQRDLGLIRSEPQYLLLQNQAVLHRAAIYDEIPPLVTALREGSHLDSVTLPKEVGVLEHPSASRYRLDEFDGGGHVFVAETADNGWKATANGTSLERVDSGWANGFDLPSDAAGPLTVSYKRTLGDIGWLIFGGIVWITVLSASFSRRRQPDLLAKAESQPQTGGES
ncbi:MAG: hypothetical protein QOH90_976, partial [Actinomycetota bacterium]|nr:hypothetical protein [Actinomycetota bacterium]